MSITIRDKKLKIRLAKYGPNELFGPFDVRTGMTEEQLVQLFDDVWNKKLKNAINQAQSYNVKQAYILLTDAEKKFFDTNQQHRQIHLEEEKLEFIAQIKITSVETGDLLTQLWKIESYKDQSVEDLLSDSIVESLRDELLKKRSEAQTWSEIYYKLGTNYKRLYLLTGAFATILTILAGSSAFADLFGSVGALGSKIVGTTTLLAGALTGLHTFLNYGRESEKFEAAGKGWGKLARKTDQKIWFVNSSANVNATSQLKIIEEITDEMNELQELSPAMTPPVYEKAKKDIELEIKLVANKQEEEKRRVYNISK